ncbi:MAG: ATP-dependent Clp protease proteolytic subunit [Candidatus Calescibacterium sp.]|nr:ATP-dependent Clp protease proteolytic subunit [Candidatus Calescibacterium sp.]MDW8132512.1 ATP-dependent Clp protease proteolytic subunit [Candidatus Calescibacterium sp.]
MPQKSYFLLYITLLLYAFFFLGITFSKITTNTPQYKPTLPLQHKKIEKDTIKVLVLEISGPITPATSWYLNNKFNKYKNKDIDFIMITIDSEGGLLNSMMEIIKVFFNSSHPVITYVYPKGSRAASAAMFILIAGHVSVMSESTNTGASTPLVQDPTLQNKIIQDLLAFTRNLCQKRNKNYEAVKETVVNATSYTEKESLNKNIIDLIAQEPNEIFEKIKNKPIILDTMTEITLRNFKKIEYTRENPNLIESFFLFIANPSIAYFLLTIGFWAIIIELNHPGSLVPLIVGIICLSLGLFGLGIISANILGIIFIIFSFILMLLELKFQSYGILTFLGLITFILGSIILFKNVNIYHPLPIGTITLASLTILGLFSYILYAVLSVRKYSSIEQIGKIGRIVKIQGDKLIVNLDGVLWEAIPLNPNTKFENNEEIEIKKVENLILIIDKKQ